MRKTFLLIIQVCLVICMMDISFAGRLEKSGEYYRYFENDGSVAYDKIVEIDRKKYYITEDGYVAFNSWVNKDAKYYYAGNDGAFYIDEIKEIDGYKYYFNADGELQKGWIDDYMYYGDLDDGFLISGFQELEIPKDMMTEVAGESTGWFYFDSNTNKKYYSDDGPYVCKTVGTSKYCFDQNGIIRTGWRMIKDTEPVMKGYMYFKDETDNDFKYGEAVNNTWYAIEPPKEVLGSSEVRYFYFNGQGVPRCAQTGKHIKVRFDDKTYLFNEYGYAVYGIFMIDNDYYYFGDSVKDCSMKTGVINKDLDLSGENCSYYFADDGKGYTGVYKNKLYYKGKIQTASEEQKYAAIKAGTITRLVNKSGTVMKNKKKVKDGDDYAWSTDSNGSITYKEPDATIMDAVPPELSGDN